MESVAFCFGSSIPLVSSDVYAAAHSYVRSFDFYRVGGKISKVNDGQNIVAFLVAINCNPLWPFSCPIFLVGDRKPFSDAAYSKQAIISLPSRSSSHGIPKFDDIIVSPIC